MTTSAEPETTFTCSVRTSPALVQVSAADNVSTAELVIELASRRADPVSCDQIVFELPVGAGSDALTAHPDRIEVAEITPGWEVVRERGVFELRPSAASPARLEPPDTVLLRLANVEVNHNTGAAMLSVREKPEPGAAALATGAFQVAKMPAGVMITSFQADKNLIGKNETVELTWSCTAGPDYWLYYGKDSQVAERVNDFIKDGKGKWTSPKLTQTTAFMLLGITKKGTGEEVRYGLTTTVIVDKPDLEVGDLRANGVVSLLGNQRVDGYVGGQSYRAETDGMLMAWVRSKGSQTAELRVSVKLAGGEKKTVSVARSLNSSDQANLLVPVPGKATVFVNASGFDGVDTEATWCPLGAGKLGPID
ncbi:hypothetical protein ATK36_0908 [Amycolatopsis sulphurea]|uniref:Uncharacterized protein n=1 Tax=Amycolatopsis sulphurea TaxID=76022 RepID=A0A2A9G3F5_9PSEU|nr:hypothetical protein [Amycolatopsis sulphurea]PFG57330.1 hypothetical protein ATK36_0908 [Amycolatopsis sulphurea]